MLIIVVLGLLTWRQAAIYRDNETFYRHIIALNPKARRIYLNLGEALRMQQRYDEALDAYRVAVAQEPNHEEAHFRIGLVLLSQGHLEEAEPHLRHAIALNPKGSLTAEAYSNLGLILTTQGHLEEALENFDRALALKPTLKGAHDNREVVLKLMSAQDPSDALDQSTTAR